MNISLKNGKTTMVISTLGAEPRSLIKNGVQYLWSGDKEYWFRVAPLLFPVTGPIKDDTMIMKGKAYKMPGNGFARDTEFKVVNANESEAIFLLEESEETLAIYPYAFSLLVTYTLHEDGYTAKATVTAKDEDLYFTYGWHPAFSLDMNGKGTDLSTYSLSFSSNERCDRRYQVDGVFNIEKDFLVGDEINLSREETDKGPIALYDVKSDEITLTSTQGEHGVTCHTGSFDTFVCWTVAPKHAQFICLEPMYSFGDATRDQKIENMWGLMELKKGESKTFENTYNIF